MVVAVTSCGDRVILSLNDMEIEGARPQLRARAAASILSSPGHCSPSEEVRRLADEKVRTLPSVDEIEVRLAYEIRVAAALAQVAANYAQVNGVELPVSTRSMLFPGCARQVTDEDIATACNAALRVANDQASLNAYLATWPTWQRLLRTEAATQLVRERISVENPSLMTPQQREGLGSECPISLCEPDADDLVFVHVGDSVQVFSLSALLQHWMEHGTNPMNRQPLALEQLRRVGRFPSPDRSNREA